MDFKIEDLKHGAKLITAPREETQAVTLLVMFRVGSRQESQDMNGVSHFIEHLFFKGTSKRPDTLSISQDLDRIGADFNAFTSKDYTGYYIKADAGQVTTVFDILSDMLFNSLFDKQEVDRERGVIAEEIRMYQDNPMMYIDDLLEQSVYSDHALGMDIAGPVETVENMQYDKLIQYRDKFYHPQNMIVGVAGRIKPAQAKQMVERYFDQSFGKQAQVATTQDFDSTQQENRINLQYKDTQQVQLAMGWPTVGSQDDDYMAQRLLAIILGGNMSSRLFINVRERNGLAYSIRTALNDHLDCATFYIQAGLATKHVNKAYALIIEQLQDLKHNPVSDEELAKAKDYLKGKQVLKIEDSFDYIYWLSKQQLSDDEVINIDQFKKQVDAVDAYQIQRLAKDIFQQTKLNMAVIGPYKDKKYFQNLITNTKL